MENCLHEKMKLVLREKCTFLVFVWAMRECCSFLLVIDLVFGHQLLMFLHQCDLLVFAHPWVGGVIITSILHRPACTLSGGSLQCLSFVGSNEWFCIRWSGIWNKLCTFVVQLRNLSNLCPDSSVLTCQCFRHRLVHITNFLFSSVKPSVRMCGTDLRTLRSCHSR